MREERWRGFQLFLSALLITWMTAAGLLASVTALSRMERTMSPEPFIVFDLVRQDESLLLTLCNQTVTIPEIPQIPEKFLPFRGRGLLLAIDGLSEGFERLIEWSVHRSWP